MSFGVNSFGIGSFGAPTNSATTLSVSADNTSSYAVRSTVSADTTTNYTLLSAVAVSASNINSYLISNFDYRIVPTGDSNASGRGSFNQTNSVTSAYLYNNSGNVVPLVDPYDGGSGQTYVALDDGVSPGGSYVQHLADLFDSAGKSVLFIPANKGGSQALDWVTTSAGTKYEALKNRVNSAGGDGVDLVFLIHLGANDANSSVSQATFKSRIETFVGNLNADFPLAKKYLQKIHHFSSAPAGAVDAIRAGVDDVLSGSSGCLRGADLEGITTNIHYGQTGVPSTCTSELNEVALRTFSAIRNVQADSSVNYTVRTTVTADSPSTYSLRSPLNSDNSAAWLIRSAISTDLAAVFNLRGIGQANDNESYGIRGLISADLQSTYQVQTQTAVSSDNTSTYSIMTASSVSASNVTGYLVRTLVISDTQPGYSVRGQVDTGLFDSYEVRSASYTDKTTSYSIEPAITSVYADVSTAYFVDGQIPSYQQGIKVKIDGLAVDVVGVYAKTGGEYAPATILVKSGGVYRLPS